MKKRRRGGERGRSGAAGPARESASPTPEGGGELPDLGTRRGASSARESESRSRGAKKAKSAADESDWLSFSAEVPQELEVGRHVDLNYRIEFAEGAEPLELGFKARTETTEPLAVVASVEGAGCEVDGPSVQEVPYPADTKPSTGAFKVRAVREGHTRVAVSFHQGGSELGAVTLKIAAVKTKPSTGISRGDAVSFARNVADDEPLELLIETRSGKDADGDDVLFYEFKLNSLALDFNYVTARSRPLRAIDGSPARKIIDYVERIYEKVAPQIRGAGDLKRLGRSLRAAGIDLCAELFDPDVTEKLWPVRKQLKVIKLTSWEPYIPWELVRLANQKTKEVDDVFLCEYGLVRTQSGRTPPTDLKLKQWSYLAAEYPNGLHTNVGREVEYFRKDLPDGDIKPSAIAPHCDALFDALQRAKFDVLHIACHAEAHHDDIRKARLVIGDRRVGEGPGATVEPIEVFPDDLTAEIGYNPEFSRRSPIVFLNGCETGQSGQSLTRWGGWPRVFIDAGASVFVGTSWDVYDGPAAVFAKAFYDTLRSGQPLAAAAQAARQEAKKIGDSSWLAFKVYGHPRARMAV